jgi:hypothetical protein
MQPRKVAAVAGAMVEVVTVEVVTVEVVTVEVVTEAEGIFTVAGISAAMAAGISAAGCISAAGATSAADRLRGRVFAAIVPSPCITPDQTPCGP